MKHLPWKLRDDAQAEAYRYFDENVRRLPRNAMGVINPSADGFQDNDVDAFRHAYVSGVFTQEYNEFIADLFGRMNEFFTADLYSNSRNPGSLNMDLWNNDVGRKRGKESADRTELLQKILDALKNGDLITVPSDQRRFQGARENPIDPAQLIVVLAENDNGRNEMFFDTTRRICLTRNEFVAEIQSGIHPSYSVKMIAGVAIPVSKPDKNKSNNLG